jgi:hypothetical protein
MRHPPVHLRHPAPAPHYPCNLHRKSRNGSQFIFFCFHGPASSKTASRGDSPEPGLTDADRPYTGDQARHERTPMRTPALPVFPAWPAPDAASSCRPWHSRLAASGELPAGRALGEFAGDAQRPFFRRSVHGPRLRTSRSSVWWCSAFWLVAAAVRATGRTRPDSPGARCPPFRPRSGEGRPPPSSAPPASSGPSNQTAGDGSRPGPASTRRPRRLGRTALHARSRVRPGRQGAASRTTTRNSCRGQGATPASGGHGKGKRGRGGRVRSRRFPEERAAWRGSASADRRRPSQVLLIEAVHRGPPDPGHHDPGGHPLRGAGKRTGSSGDNRELETWTFDRDESRPGSTWRLAGIRPPLTTSAASCLPLSSTRSPAGRISIWPGFWLTSMNTNPIPAACPAPPRDASSAPWQDRGGIGEFEHREMDEAAIREIVQGEDEAAALEL